MHLPLHTRALALVVALSTTSAIIITVAEMGHPPSDGYGAIASLLVPARPHATPLALVTADTGAQQPASAEMPQP